jgi:hypothetical protein
MGIDAAASSRVVETRKGAGPLPGHLPHLVDEARVRPDAPSRTFAFEVLRAPPAQNFAQRNHQSVFKPIFRQRRFCVPVH